MQSKVTILPNKIIIVFGFTAMFTLITSMLIFPVVWQFGLYAGIGLLSVSAGLKLIYNGFLLRHKIKMMQLERLKESHLIVASNSYVFNTNNKQIYAKALQHETIINGDFTPVEQIKDVLSLTKTAYHFLLVGDTGSGKSTLARAIINEVNADTLVLDPHAAFNEWPSQVKIIQDYNSIGIALERIVKLMDNRYATGDNGKTILVAIDETPAVIDELKELGYDAGRMIRRLSREGRKANIVLILMSQGENVGDLGQKGYGSVKYNFVKILLNRPDTLQSKCKVEFANGDNKLYSLPNPTLQSLNSVKPKTLQLSSGVKTVKCANPNCDNSVKPGSLYCKENYNACKQVVYRLNNGL